MYNDYYASQLTELMTNYGEIYECWWDGAGSTEANYDWKSWVEIVRKNQKDKILRKPAGKLKYKFIVSGACYSHEIWIGIPGLRM